MKTKKIIKVLKFLRQHCNIQYSCSECEFQGMCKDAFFDLNIELIEKRLKDVERIELDGN